MPTTLSVETADDGVHSIVMHGPGGAQLGRIDGSYETLHGLIMSLEMDLEPTRDELAEIRRSLWDVVMADILEEGDWTDEEGGIVAVDKVARIVFGDCESWDDDRWYPSNYVRLFGADGEDLSHISRDVEIMGLRDSDLYSELRLLTDMFDGESFASQWTFTLNKPDSSTDDQSEH